MLCQLRNEHASEFLYTSLCRNYLLQVPCAKQNFMVRNPITYMVYFG